MKVIVQSQRDTGTRTHGVRTHYIGEVGTPTVDEMRELAIDFWPFASEPDNWDEFLEERFIENGMAFYALDMDSDGYNVHTQVKFVSE